MTPVPKSSRTESDTLFDNSSPVRPETYLVAHVDGGARGNPGPAGYGVVLQDQAGKRVAALSEYLGHQTNNYAEYRGLIAALEYALEHNWKALHVISDSELLVRQIRGIYKVKNPVLQDLYARARQFIRKLDHFEIGHVLRAKNRDADRLANEAMDRGTGKRISTTPSPSSSENSASNQLDGIVRDGVVQLLGGKLPDGTLVKVTPKKHP